MSNEKQISVKNIQKKIKDKVILNNISFDIYSGECVALIGPNGAGKTTLMNILLGNKFQTAGVAKIANLDAKDNKLKSIINVLNQENSAPDNLKVKELLNFAQNIYENSLTNEEIDSLLMFDDKQKDTLISKLSGGQKRLLSFVVTLIGKPKILFLDEPTAAMDTSTRIRFWEIINNLKKDGLTIIYSSHYIEEVEHTADRILVLHKGQLIRDTTPHAMRSEKIEKHFTLPINYLDVVKNLDFINNIVVKNDSFTFSTLYGEKTWNILVDAGCKFEDLEVQNRTLLDSIFNSTKEV